MRWARENDFDSIIQAMVQSFSWPVDQQQVFTFVKAIIGQESAFNPAAYRQEPNGNGSAGLMQVTLTTAMANGFPGPIGDPDQLSGLFDPGANVYQGVKLINQLVQQIGPDWEAVASAYNGGYRPSIGMGARATRQITVCLARDPEGNCTRTFTAQPGEFGNQPYVDAIDANLDYFNGNGVAGAGGPPVPPLSTGEVASSPLTWIFVGSILLLGYLATR